MKSSARHGLVLASLFLFVLAGCKPVPWIEFKSADGNFSVLMPGTPTADVQTVNTQSGQIEIHFYTLSTKNAVYSVSYSDYPASIFDTTPIKSILDGARDGAVKNTQGRLIDEADIALGAYPGRELNVESSGGTNVMQAHLYVVNHRLYQVIVVTGKGRASSPDLQKFLDSFKLATP
jgi:hypothetical protein